MVARAGQEQSGPRRQERSVSTTAQSRAAGARDGAAVQTLEMAIAEATDPVILRNLRAVAEHVDAEVAGEIDRLMATLVSEPAYHIWGASKSVGPQGFDEVRANYQSLIRSGKNRLTY